MLRRFQRARRPPARRRHQRAGHLRSRQRPRPRRPGEIASAAASRSGATASRIPRRRVPGGGPTLPPTMTLVVKLGSSIVAAEDGSLRTDVLDAVCAQVAELHAGGEEVVMVTSGAIARGRRLIGLGRAPVRRRRAPGRLGGRAGIALPLLRGTARGGWRQRRPGAPDGVRHVGADPLPERPPDPAAAARLARRPGHQRERHDRDRRDHLRRQRLPLRPGRDHDRGPAADSAHRPDRPLLRRSAHERRCRAGRAGHRHRPSSTATRSARGPPRSAPEGCAARSWPRRWRAAPASG